MLGKRVQVGVRGSICLLVVMGWLAAPGNAGSLREDEEKWTQETFAEYFQTATTFPADEFRAYSYREKIANRERVKSSLYIFRSYGRKDIRGGEARQAARQRLDTELLNLALQITPLSREEIRYALNSNVLGGLGDYLRRVRQDDSTLHSAEHLQAGRNLAVALGIQHLTRHPVTVTDPVYYYSLLYPYTDNYIDDPAIDKQGKLAFGKWLQARIDGKAEAPQDNAWLKKIDHALSSIEAKYPRAEFAEAYDSLKCIHRAQMTSMGQDAPGAMNKPIAGYEKPVAASDKISSQTDPILHVTIWKGGAAVIGDAYMVEGSVKRDDASNLFRLGALCQYIDDFQDCREDVASNHATYYSRLVARGQVLDGEANRLLRLITSTCKDLEKIRPDAKPLIDAAHSVALFLVYSAVAGQREYFSPEYLKEFEKYLMVTLKDFHEIEKWSQEGEGGDELVRCIMLLGSDH